MARVYVLYNIMYFFLTCYFVFLIRIYFFDVHKAFVVVLIILE